MRWKNSICYFLAASALFSVFSMGDAGAQFNPAADSDLRIPIPMRMLLGEEGKDIPSLQLDTVIQDNFFASQLALDSNVFYWVNRGGSTVLRYGKLRGGRLDTDGDLDRDFTGEMLSIDQGRIYWMDPAKKTLHYGEVVDGRLKDGGHQISNFNPKLFAVDGGTLYWQEDNDDILYFGKIVDDKVQKQGQLEKNFRAKLLTADKGVLYWVDRNSRALRSSKVKDGKMQSPGVLSSNFTGKLLNVENGGFYWLNQKKEELCFGRIR